MNFKAYCTHFENILNAKEKQAPYDNIDYLNYTKLNWARMNRWLKNASLSNELITLIKSIKEPQQWIIIAEPWCGDAAHNIPFIEMLANKNTLISISYQLRDTAPFLIDNYLTNGTKSIPILIIRNSAGRDLAVWGPRPKSCQEMYDVLKKENADFEKIKIEIQNWYNADKGISLQKELSSLIKQTL